MQAAQRVGHLAVDAHRVDEPRDADDARVGGQEQDRGGEQADVDLASTPWKIPRSICLTTPSTGSPAKPPSSSVSPSCGLVLAVGVPRHRQRGERDRRQREVDREHREPHAVDRRRDRRRLVLGLLGHVRDRLDARVGEHADRDREDEVAPTSARRRATTLSTSVSGEKTSTAPTSTSSSWVRKSITASVTLIPVDSLAPNTLTAGQQRDHDDRRDDVAGARAAAPPRTRTRRRCSAARRTPRWRS